MGKVENPLAKFVAVVNNQCRCGSLGDFTVAGIRETLRDALYEYETARAPEGERISDEVAFEQWTKSGPSVGIFFAFCAGRAFDSLAAHASSRAPEGAKNAVLLPRDVQLELVCAGGQAVGYLTAYRQTDTAKDIGQRLDAVVQLLPSLDAAHAHSEGVDGKGRCCDPSPHSPHIMGWNDKECPGIPAPPKEPTR